MATILDDGWTAVQLSCRDNTNNEVFLYLIDVLGANVNLRNKNGASLMHKAALDDNTYVITYLRDKAGFSVHDTDFQGNTPLHLAAARANSNAIDWLLGFGADVNAQNKKKDTPLIILTKNPQAMSNTSCVRTLIMKGADKEFANSESKKALDYVANFENEDLKKELTKMLGPQPLYIPCFHFK